MNILIKTGFKEISHSLLFKRKSIKKGKQLIKAKHVINVGELRENGCSYHIEARVIRQTSVTSSPYKVTLNIDANLKVTKVSSDCVYIMSDKCKHSAAVIEYIINH